MVGQEEPEEMAKGAMVAPEEEIVANIRDSILIKNAIRQSNSKTMVTIREKYIPGFYRFTFWFAIIAWAGLLIWLIIKLGVIRFMK